MLVTPVMFCTHLSLSHPLFSQCQMATNYTTLNINTVEWSALGKSTLRRRECNRQHIKKVLFFSWKWKEKLFSVTVSRSTWKIKSASHVCHHMNSRLYLQFTVYTLLKAQRIHVSETSLQNDTSSWCLGRAGAKNESRMKDWVFMYKFMGAVKKGKHSLVPRALRESLEISVSKLVKTALISLLIVPAVYPKPRHMNYD